MVRIGGGWNTLDNYLARCDPCRCGGQKNSTSSAYATSPTITTTTSATTATTETCGQTSSDDGVGQRQRRQLNSTCTDLPLSSSSSLPKVTTTAVAMATVTAATVSTAAVIMTPGRQQQQPLIGRLLAGDSSPKTSKALPVQPADISVQYPPNDADVKTSDVTDDDVTAADVTTNDVTSDDVTDDDVTSYSTTVEGRKSNSSYCDDDDKQNWRNCSSSGPTETSIPTTTVPLTLNASQHGVTSTSTVLTSTSSSPSFPTAACTPPVHASRTPPVHVSNSCSRLQGGLDADARRRSKSSHIPLPLRVIASARRPSQSAAVSFYCDDIGDNNNTSSSCTPAAVSCSCRPSLGLDSVDKRIRQRPSCIPVPLRVAAQCPYHGASISATVSRVYTHQRYKRCDSGVDLNLSSPDFD